MPPCVCSRVYPGVCLPVCVVGYTRVYIPLRTMGGMLGIYTSQDHGRHAGYVTHYGCPVSELPRAQKHAPRHPFHCWRAGQPPYYSPVSLLVDTPGSLLFTRFTVGLVLPAGGEREGNPGGKGGLLGMVGEEGYPVHTPGYHWWPYYPPHTGHTTLPGST